ncbi:MAG: glycosyltransferase [Eubacteriales bacterium]
MNKAEKHLIDSFQSLTVIVPVVTETKTLIETVETVIQTIKKSDLKEIIICPAYFTLPESKKITKDLCEKYHDVPVIILMQEGTFEDLIKDMFKTVSGSHFIIQPSDLEEDPRILSVFLQISKANPNAIITGSRFLSKECSKNYSIVKKFVFVFFRRLFKTVYSQNLTDTTFFYRIIPTEAVKNLVINQKSYSVLYEAFLKMIRVGFEVIEIPVEFQKRQDGKPRVKFFKDGIRYLWVFFRVRFADIKKFYT